MAVRRVLNDDRHNRMPRLDPIPLHCDVLMFEAKPSPFSSECSELSSVVIHVAERDMTQKGGYGVLMLVPGGGFDAPPVISVPSRRSRSCQSLRRDSRKSGKGETTSFRPSCGRVAVLARRTDSNSPAGWLFIASGDLEGVRELASRELAYAMCVSKLAEILEKII